jgi:radical SAM protein with 4Fe4S-binding SPASM domain
MICYPLSWLSAKRVCNLAKLGTSYMGSVLLRRNAIKGYPYAASIEPANYCNLSCPQCPTGRHQIDKKAQNLSYQDFSYVVDALSPYLMYLNLYFQGESFLNKDLPKMIQYANRKKIYTCVSTNGHFLTLDVIEALKQSGLKRLIICLAGANQQSYEKYRVGGDFTKVTEGIKRCVELGLPVEVQCLLLQSTENEKQEIIRLVKSLGVKKFYFKKAQFYDNYLLPKEDKNRRYVQMSDGSLRTKRKWKNRCFRMWSSVIVDVYGRVLPCCYDKHAAHAYGNMLNQSFYSIWNGDKAAKFREQIRKDRTVISMCTNCTE